MMPPRFRMISGGPNLRGTAGPASGCEQALIIPHSLAGPIIYWRVGIYTVEVQVHLKDGVTDPVGSNTKKTLELLGIQGITGVRSVSGYVFQVDAPDGEKAMAAVEDACRRLLANPVIHRYTVQLKGEGE